MAVRFFEFLQKYRSQCFFYDDRGPCTYKVPNKKKTFLSILTWQQCAEIDLWHTHKSVCVPALYTTLQLHRFLLFLVFFWHAQHITGPCQTQWGVYARYFFHTHKRKKSVSWDLTISILLPQKINKMFTKYMYIWSLRYLFECLQWRRGNDPDRQNPLVRLTLKRPAIERCCPGSTRAQFFFA